METFSAAAQIAILYTALYWILKSAKGSRFGQALMGIGILTTLLALFTYLFHFHVLSLIIKYLLIYLSISTVVIFQPEIRRILATVGALGGGSGQQRGTRGGAATPEAFVEAVALLSSRRLGALFAFERGISLRGYEESGVVTDAAISKELLTAVFTPPLPLHDGGAVVRDGRLASAHCIFPVSNNPDLVQSGMRHRAAVGMSEETDAIVLVVSEETGAISVAHNGKIIRYPAQTGASDAYRWIARGLGEKSGGPAKRPGLAGWADALATWSGGLAGMFGLGAKRSGAAGRVHAAHTDAAGKTQTSRTDRGGAAARFKAAAAAAAKAFTRNFWLKALALALAFVTYGALHDEAEREATVSARRDGADQMAPLRLRPALPSAGDAEERTPSAAATGAGTGIKPSTDGKKSDSRK